jgi:predicted amidohydrolase
MYTINPAILLNHDNMTGTLEVGKYADFVVLDIDLLELQPEKIDQAMIVSTFLQGKTVYDPNGVFGLKVGKSRSPQSSSCMSLTGISIFVGIFLLGSHVTLNMV